MPRLLILIATLALTASACFDAHAARSDDNCTNFIDTLPATIGTQGTWCLRHDVATGITTGSAIDINANNVTLDCNDFKIGGLAAGAGTQAYGILASGRTNTTLRNCNVRGFLVGIALDGPGTLVEDNWLDGNTFTGMQVNGDGGIIRRNRINKTGNSTWVFAGWYSAIRTSGSVDVLDNTIIGVYARSNGTSTASHAIGITADSYRHQVVSGNRISDLTGYGAGYTRGIEHSGTSAYVAIVGNRFDIPGGDGVVCGDGTGVMKDNVFSGSESTMWFNCANGGGNGN